MSISGRAASSCAFMTTAAYVDTNRRKWLWYATPVSIDVDVVVPERGRSQYQRARRSTGTSSRRDSIADDAEKRFMLPIIEIIVRAM